MIGIAENKIREIADRIGYTESEYQDVISRCERAGLFSVSCSSNGSKVLLPPQTMGGVEC